MSGRYRHKFGQRLRRFVGLHMTATCSLLCSAVTSDSGRLVDVVPCMLRISELSLDALRFSSRWHNLQGGNDTPSLKSNGRRSLEVSEVVLAETHLSSQWLLLMLGCRVRPSVFGNIWCNVHSTG